MATTDSSTTTGTSSSSKRLTPDSINPRVVQTKYAVRGELYLRGAQLQAEGKKIIFTNVGNPQSLGQLPITFPRQVLALMQAPFLMDNPDCARLFPEDAIARAKKYLSFTSGGIGAYSDSRGVSGIRKEVAEFIERRDGYSCNPDLIFLTDGASKGVQNLLQVLIRGVKDGILCPIPQYPLYSATITLLGGSLVPYYLDESQGWAMTVAELESAVTKAETQDGISVRALVLINPGNPTGQCLTEANLRELIRFCHEHSIVLLADEVYQENIYRDDHPFVSTRKVMYDMGEPYASEVQLVSFHTVSKGTFGECGQRGGYMQLTNFHPGVVDELYKLSSIALCPNLNGQMMVGLMVNPPQPGEPSHDQYAAERKAILDSMKRRAHLITDSFNSCQGVHCNATEGAMYSFPELELPPAALEAAQKAGKAADVFYCLKLLEATGISTVPGSGFGQKPGTFHLRTTILPQESEMPHIMQLFKDFHASFMKQYGGDTATATPNGTAA